MNHAELNSDSVDPREEELVAYLDGELSDEQSRRVEEQLASNEAYRQSLQRLERAWNCLDELPVTAVGDTFTRSTVEMVAVAASQEIAEQQAALPRQRRLRSVLTVGALLASLLVGFFVFAVVWPDPNERLVRDYELFTNLDAYLQIQDVSFLRSLGQEIKTIGIEVVFLDINPVEFTVPQAPAGRLTAIRKMSPEGKAQLASARDRFDALSPERRETARRVYREIHQADDSQELLATLSLYYPWIMQLSPGQRAELTGLSPKKRLASVKKIYNDQQKRLAQQLSDEDMKSLQGWLQGYVRKNQREILAKVPEHYRREMAMRLHHDEMGKRRPGLMMIALRRNEILRTLQVSEEDMQQLKQQLSPPARKVLDQAGAHQKQQETVKRWIYRTIRKRMEQGLGGSQTRASQADLEKFFAEKLTNDQREQLLSLSGDEMQRELRRVYQDSINLAPQSRSNPGSGRPSYDRSQGRPGGQFRRGGPGGHPQGKSRHQPPFDKRPGRGPFPPSRDRTKDQVPPA